MRVLAFLVLLASALSSNVLRGADSDGQQQVLSAQGPPDDLCGICKTSLSTWATVPTAESLAKSCDEYTAMSSGLFVQCRSVWSTRYSAVQKLRASGCNVDGVLQKPCASAEALCTSLTVFGGKKPYC